MRDIIFRGKSIETGKWFYGDLWRRAQNMQGTIYTFIAHNGGCFERVDPETVGQYIGLNDKNNTQIFEGDLVKYKTNYYGNTKDRYEEIMWQEDINTDLFGEPSAFGYIVRWTVCEIIGNIYDKSTTSEAGNTGSKTE